MVLPFFRTRLAQGALRLMGFGSAVLVGLGLGLASVVPAQAAEDIVFTYGALGRSISIEDLAELAETGETPDSLRWYLDLADIEPEVLQTILSEELPLGLLTVDRILNSLPGEYALFQVGQVVSTRSGRANIQALRSAVVLSVSEDNRITLLEFLQNYPTQQIYVDGVELAAVARDVGEAVEDVQDVARRLLSRWTIVRSLLDSVICECEAP